MSVYRYTRYFAAATQSPAADMKCEAAPRMCADFAGLRPMPHLGIFFGKKIPKNPKKPNCIGFKPSNTDSKQGCRRQPCFFARRRQHGTATAPTPRAPAVPPAPAARRAAPHSPVVHPTLTVVPSVIAPSLRLLARRSPCPALTARRTVRNRSSPRRSFETADY